MSKNIFKSFILCYVPPYLQNHVWTPVYPTSGGSLLKCVGEEMLISGDLDKMTFDIP